MKRRLAAVLLAGLTGVACSGLPSGHDLPPEANRMKPEHAPTPFSAAQIRNACPLGRGVKFELVKADGSKEYHVTLFTGGTDETARMEVVLLDEDQKPRGPGESRQAGWLELQAHASFPARSTTISSERFTAPVGTFDCWRYEVADKKDGQPQLARYWFAKELPGPPVCVERWIGNRLESRLTMVRAR